MARHVLLRPFLQVIFMTTALLLHGDPLVANRLRQMIEAEVGPQVIGMVHTVAAARAFLVKTIPDLLLTSLTLPDGEVQPLLGHLRRNGRSDRPQLLVLAMSSEDPRLMDALRHGADGYHTPERSVMSLVGAMEQVLNGESPISPTIARHVIAHFAAMEWGQSDFVGESQNTLRLSHAERLLLQWTAEGYLPGEVARALRTDLHGVGVQVRAIYHKLRLDAQAASLTLQTAA